MSESRQELAQEKRRDYRKTVLLQIAILFAELILEDLFRLLGLPLPYGPLKVTFYALTCLYLYFLCDMLRNFTLQRWLLRLVPSVLIVSVGILFVLDVVMAVPQASLPYIRVLCHGIILVAEVVIIGFALRDLFEGRRHEVDRLWGSACIYFMSGFAFAGVYFCILTLDPGAFGRPLPADYWALFEALYLSLTSLIGLDSAYPDCTRLVRNVGLLEGAWSQLYMVLLIGRLLVRDEKDPAS